MKKAILRALLVTALILPWTASYLVLRYRIIPWIVVLRDGLEQLEYQIVTMHDSFSFECIARCSHKDEDDGPNDFKPPVVSPHKAGYKNKRADKCKLCNLSAQSGASRSCM